jgi:hypothetical protein
MRNRSAAVATAAALALAGGTLLATQPATAATTTTTTTTTGTVYYVSSSQGNDANSGTSPSAPWQSLDKVNAAQLNPGDQVLFADGDTFDGQLTVNSSGTAAAPIVFGAYGTGAAPLIQGSAADVTGGSNLAAVLVQNQQYLEFDDLALQNNRTVTRAGVADTDAYGLYINNTGTTNLQHYRINNVTIGNVIPLAYPGNIDANFVSGLSVQTQSTGTVSDVVIQNSTFTQNGRFGATFISNPKVSTATPTRSVQDVTFQNNTCTDNGGSCLMGSRVQNLLIQNNTVTNPGSTGTRLFGRGSGMWFIQCDDVVAQYNTVTGARGPADSSNIHIDAANHNVLIQYNTYSDNIGYGLEILGGNDTVIVRYNYSMNDGYRAGNGAMLFLGNYVPGTAGGQAKAPTNLWIYNNTYTIDPSMHEPFQVDATNSHIYNNLFTAYWTGTITGPTVAAESTGNTITNNLFNNAAPGVSALDAAPVVAAPKFNVAQGTSPSADYRLMTISPALGAGTTAIAQPAFAAAGQGIFANVGATATTDYFGNPIPATPNIGADQGAGVP